eukprot:ctg_728.g357
MTPLSLSRIDKTHRHARLLHAVDTARCPTAAAPHVVSLVGQCQLAQTAMPRQTQQRAIGHLRTERQIQRLHRRQVADAGVGDVLATAQLEVRQALQLRQRSQALVIQQRVGQCQMLQLRTAGGDGLRGTRSELPREERHRPVAHSERSAVVAGARAIAPRRGSRPIAAAATRTTQAVVRLRPAPSGHGRRRAACGSSVAPNSSAQRAATAAAPATELPRASENTPRPPAHTTTPTPPRHRMRARAPPPTPRREGLRKTHPKETHALSLPHRVVTAAAPATDTDTHTHMHTRESALRPLTAASVARADAPPFRPLCGSSTAAMAEREVSCNSSSPSAARPCAGVSGQGGRPGCTADGCRCGRLLVDVSGHRAHSQRDRAAVRGVSGHGDAVRGGQRAGDLQCIAAVGAQRDGRFIGGGDAGAAGVCGAGRPVSHGTDARRGGLGATAVRTGGVGRVVVVVVVLVAMATAPRRAVVAAHGERLARRLRAPDQAAHRDLSGESVEPGDARRLIAAGQSYGRVGGDRLRQPRKRPADAARAVAAHRPHRLVHARPAGAVPESPAPRPATARGQRHRRRHHPIGAQHARPLAWRCVAPVGGSAAPHQLGAGGILSAG